MKKPAVVLHFHAGFVDSVEVIKAPDIFDPQHPPADLQEGKNHPGHSDVSQSLKEDKNMARDFLRLRARKKKPVLPLLVQQLPQADEDVCMECLSVLDRPLPASLRFIEDPEQEKTKIPKRMPSDNFFIGMAEWPFRPADTLVEAYSIATNKRSRYWFLVRRTVDDLSPYTTRYLDTTTIALLEKKGLEIKEASVLLLYQAWMHARHSWTRGCFFMISDTGLLDIEILEAIARKVWPEEVIR